MKKKIIIGLVGEIASGKGTAAQYLQERYGAEICRFSTPLRDVVKRLHMDVDRQTMQAMSKCLRETFGQDLLAKIITEDAKKSPANIVVVDGIRREADIVYLKEIPRFALVYITADMEIRYQRIIGRNENQDDQQKTFEQFVKDHEAETELDIPKLGATVDEACRIDNNGNLEQLRRRLDEVIEEI
jgi:dephospho-CoA kinase